MLVLRFRTAREAEGLLALLAARAWRGRIGVLCAGDDASLRLCRRVAQFADACTFVPVQGGGPYEGLVALVAVGEPLWPRN